MPSPLVHTIMGVLLGTLSGQSRAHIMRGRDWLALILVSNLHDLDFIPGLLGGDLIRYHHFATHSLFFCVVLAVLCWMINRRYLPLLLLASILHPLLDLLTADIYHVYDRHWGIPLLWPFTDTAFWPPCAIFAAPYVGGDMTMLFSKVNMQALLRELMFIVVLPGGVFLWVAWRKRRQCR
jgi:membrane-bound metal-dependent hydrolase YbcI (DUF457 family)